MPKLSIIIPAYQAEETIGQAVQSVLDNTFQDFELLVVDDGSKDRTAQIVEGIADNRIRLISKENGGVSSARNRGLQEVCGEYVMFLDSDDVYYPSYCALMVQRMEETEADIVVAGYEEYYENRIVTQLCPVQGVLNSREEIYEEFICPTYCSGLNGYLGSVCIAIFRRSQIQSLKLRFSESIRIAEDKLFLVKYLLHSQRMATVDSIQYRYVLHTGSATKHYQKQNAGANEFQIQWHRILTEAGYAPDEAQLAKEAIAEVFSVLCNEARPGNPKGIREKLRTVFWIGSEHRRQIRALNAENRTLKIKRFIALHGHLCVSYYLYRRLLCKLGRVE